jgi:hypothetical protein
MTDIARIWIIRLGSSQWLRQGANILDKLLGSGHSGEIGRHQAVAGIDAVTSSRSDIA